MGLTLPQFIAKLDTFAARVPLPELETMLRELELAPGELERYYSFSTGHYTRNPIALGPAYQALVLCWLPGQESVIHDHQGSSCAVRILEGECTEVAYDWQADGSLGERQGCCLDPGCICGTQDYDIAHYQPVLFAAPSFEFVVNELGHFFRTFSDASLRAA